MKTFILSALAISVVAFSSCKKEKSVETSTLNYQITTTNDTTGTVKWTGGSANITAIAFGTSQTTSVDSTSLDTTANLFTSSAAALGSLKLTSGTYNSPYFTVQLSSLGSAPSLQLTGTATDGTTTLPVVIDLTDAIKLQATQAVTLTSSATYTVTFTLDLSAVTQGLSFSDFAAATQSDNGVLISSSSNATLYNTIENNIATALTVSVQ